jgi:acetoin utilization protein AcuB
MIALDLITDDIPPLRPDETQAKALKWMDEFKVSHIPVVNGKEYCGLVSDTILYDANNPDGKLSELPLASFKPFVFDHQHVYEVMNLVSAMNLSAVPIIDKDEHFLGSTTLPHLMRLITNSASISEAGGIIVLEMNQNDYSLTEIARIVEGNDAKILSSYVTSATDSTKLEITLKINKRDLTRILQTFYRYEYTVSASYQESRFDDDMKDRFEAFLKFMNM